MSSTPLPIDDAPNGRHKPGPETATDRLERWLREHAKQCYVLCLFVTGMTPRSTEAIESIKAICEELLAGRYELTVVDIAEHPTMARDEQIIAVPTLVRSLPLPRRRLIGDLGNRDRLLLGLGISLNP